MLFDTKTKTDSAFLRLGVDNKQKVKRQNETTITLELSGLQQFEQVISSVKNSLVVSRPAYKVDQQELYYTDEIIFEAKPGAKKEDIIRIVGLSNSIVKEDKQFFTIIKIPSILDACEIANRIQESGLVKFSHPNFIMPLETHQVIPNDTYFNNQYYLQNTGQVFNPVENHAGIPGADMRASWAWTMTGGNNAIIVAVLDQGVTANHPDLPNARQVRLNGSNFIINENANDPTPNGNDNHGNACAGIVAATQGNNEGISGIAPNVRIMPVKILGGNIDNAGIANAIDFAWQNGAHILSNSWGTNLTNPNAIPVIVQAIQRAVTQGRNGLGCIVAFSASNSASHAVNRNGQVRFPSNVQINGVLTVGASNRFDQQADYSPQSNTASTENQIIDIVAPSHNAYPPEIYAFNGDFGGIVGETFEVWSIDIPGNAGYNIWQTPGYGNFPAFGETLPNFGVNNFSYTGRMGGTSASCPEVAGVAALLLSINPNLTQQQIFDILTQTADDVGGYTYVNGWCPEMGNGRLNACAAIAQVFPRLITGLDAICSSGVYSVPTLGASNYSWSVDNPNLASIVGNGNSATIARNGSFMGNLQISVTITGNCGTKTVTKTVWVGAPLVQGWYNSPTNPSEPLKISSGKFDFNWNDACYTQFITTNMQISGGSTVVWEDAGNSGGVSWGQIGNNLQFYFSNINQYAYFRIRVTNSCGTSTHLYRFRSVGENCSGGMMMLMVSPNPTKDKATLSLKDKIKGEEKDIKEIRIIDKSGNIIKQLTYAGGTRKPVIDVSILKQDIYTILAFDGAEWTATKLAVQ